MGVNETRNYTHVAEEVKEFSPELAHEVYDLGSELESAETEKEMKKDEIETMLDVLEDEVDELEGFLNILSEGNSQAIEARLEKTRRLIRIMKKYNLN